MSLYQNPFEPINKRLSNIESLLLDLKHSPIPHSDKKTNSPVGIKDISKLIDKSVPTIYGYVQRNEIPHSKKGGKLYFFENEVIDWIKSGRQKTVQEIQEEVDTTLSIGKCKNKI